MAISEDEAGEILKAHLRETAGPDPDLRFRATPIPNTSMWSVTAYHDAGHAGPAIAVAYIVGPDRKVWVFSGNPQIHDVPLAIGILRRIYKERLADHVEPERFATRLAEVTDQRRVLAESLVTDARSGVLKSQHRPLP